METARANLFTRDDTMLGVCEALGQDLGFNPLWLRLTLGVMLIWQPVAVICAYLAAGVVVLASRLIFPQRRPAEQDAIEAETDAPAPADREEIEERVLLAA